MMKKTSKSVLMLVCCLAACGVELDEGAAEYGTTVQATMAPFESMNTTELLGVYAQDDLQIPHTSNMQLVLGKGLQCKTGSLDCKGATLQAFDANGALQLLIEDRSGDFYTLKYRRPTDAGWKPLCTVNSGPTAIAVPGSWKLDGSRVSTTPHAGFTFACQNSAAHKCTAYHRYGTQTAQYQACTRMLRADFCGSGRAYTATGLQLDVLDVVPGSVNSAWDFPWPFEAAWGTDGAVCVSSGRNIGAGWNLGLCPGKIKPSGSCNESTPAFSSTVLLKSRFKQRAPSCGTCTPAEDCHCGLDRCWPKHLPCP